MKIEAKTSWDSLPIDVSNLFNPAFCCLLINRVCAGFSPKGSVEGLPFALSFAAIPLLLHSSTVECMPSKANTKLHLWLMKNPGVLFGFGERAQGLSSFVRVAISFGIKSGTLISLPDSSLTPGALPALRNWEASHGTALAYKRAEVLGKLLRQAGNVPTIYALLGIRP